MAKCSCEDREFELHLPVDTDRLAADLLHVLHEVVRAAVLDLRALVASADRDDSRTTRDTSANAGW